VVNIRVHHVVNIRVHHVVNMGDGGGSAQAAPSSVVSGEPAELTLL
jgi:hypothetical protein